MPSRRAMSKRSRIEVEDHQVRKKTASFPIHNEAQTAERPRNLPSRGYALPPEDDWEGASSRSSAEGFF